jgi:hypothetical protein
MNTEHEIIKSLCQAYGKPIENAFLRAVKRFYELHGDELLAIRPATKASLINDYIYQYLSEALESTRFFHFIVNHKGRFIEYDSKILIRIKKLNQSRKPAVNKTDSAERFNTQGDMELIEDARASNIYLGYVLNRDSGSIDRVAFSYPNESGVIAWTIDINNDLVERTLDFNVVSITSDKEGKAKNKGSHFSPKFKDREKNKA